MTGAIDLARRAAPISVSVHALRRYLERVRGFVSRQADDRAALQSFRDRGADVDGARAEIERLVGLAVAVGAISVKCGNMRFVIDGRTVVTVMPTVRSD